MKLSAATPRITVFKDPNCRCCNGWIDHLKKNGFEVDVKQVSIAELRQLKTRHGVASELQTCHTATVEGYVIEGHVPAADIKRLLRERPKAAGLAVPGMPIGSPGMEGGKQEAYSVLLFDAAAKTSVFQRYPAQ
jgi:hypothetical protein